jgi:hypothetical protein
MDELRPERENGTNGRAETKGQMEDSNREGEALRIREGKPEPLTVHLLLLCVGVSVCRSACILHHAI